MPSKVEKRVGDVWREKLMRVLIEALFKAVQNFHQLEELLASFHEIQYTFYDLGSAARTVAMTLDSAQYAVKVARTMSVAWHEVGEALVQFRRLHLEVLKLDGRLALNGYLTGAQGKVVNLWQEDDVYCWNKMLQILESDRTDQESLAVLKLHHTEPYLWSCNPDQLEKLMRCLKIPTDTPDGVAPNREDAEYRDKHTIISRIIAHQAGELKAATTQKE